MSQLPTAIPNILPEGEYKFEITDVKEFSSTFDKGKSYWKMYFSVQDAKGEDFTFSLSINPKMQKYRDILQALGVAPDEQGFMHPPDDVVGMKFRGDIYQRQAANDKSKTINDIKNLQPTMKSSNPKSKASFSAEEDPGDSEVPF